MHYSAKSDIASVRPSVFPSVWPSETLVDQDHIGWKSWKLIARSISPTPSLFQRPSTYSQENIGRLEVGWESGVLEHKSGNISETRTDRGKVTMESLQEVTNVLSNGTIADPLRPPHSQDWGWQPHPKTAIAIISGMAKATDCKFGRYIHNVHPNKSLLKLWEKGAWAYAQTAQIFAQITLLSHERVKLRTVLQIWPIHSQGPSERIQGLPIFCIPRIIPGTGKATSFKLCTHIHSIDRNKGPLKFRKKSPWVYSGTLEYRAHRGVIFAIVWLFCHSGRSHQQRK